MFYMPQRNTFHETIIILKALRHSSYADIFDFEGQRYICCDACIRMMRLLNTKRLQIDMG